MHKMAKITGIYLKNFQSIREPVFLNLEKLTFLLGPNSVGKSSIYDALNLIQKIVNRENVESIFKRYTPTDKISTIGIEVEVSKNCFDEDEMPYSIYNSCRDWWDKKDRAGDYGHNDFFRKLKNKKIQIEFSDEGKSIKIAVDGQSLVECVYQSSYINPDYQIVDVKNNEKSDEDNDRDYLSSVYIHTNSLLNLKNYSSFCQGDMIYGPETLLKSFFYNLFVENGADYKRYFGIGLQNEYLNESKSFHLESKVANYLFSNKDYWQYRIANAENITNKSLEKKIKKEIDVLKKIVESDFNDDKKINQPILGVRRDIFNGLQNLSEDLNILTQGFYYLIDSTLRHTHVSGSRGIIDSEIAIIDETKNNLSLQNSIEQYPLLKYAYNLREWYSENIMDDNGIGDINKNDYVNLAIKKFMPSIKNYRIIPESYSVVYQNLKFIEDIHKWMWKDKPKIIHIYILNPTGNKLNLRDVGSGIGFILPILASLSESELSFIEQPELHLHPSAQCEIGDVFISALNRGNRAIVESHSEYILLRILRRIRETHNGYLLPKELNIKPDDINIYYFQPTTEGTRIKHIRVDAFGEFIDRFPNGFFPERDIELFGGMEPFNE